MIIIIIIIIIYPAVFSFSSVDDLKERRYTEEKMQRFDTKITTKSDIRYTYRKIYLSINTIKKPYSVYLTVFLFSGRKTYISCV